ncbi:hypothetical protein [Methylocystis sp.]|uniref:hypothetical protein n=1 Tax=Methylocystis sp. TaxID=1911079 RepID=UPI0025FE5BA5|nr:hypothetical protein [Methylocystis sp.]
MTQILWGALLFIGLVGPAAAGLTPSVPAPEVGGGVVGMLLAVGAVYLIKRRGR